MTRFVVIALAAGALIVGGCDAGTGVGGHRANRRADTTASGGHAGETWSRQCAWKDAEGGAACRFQIELYCEYGAVSSAQLGECNKHATLHDIKRLNTNAASFARMDLQRCLADAGQFCQDAVKQLEQAQEAQAAADRADYYGTLGN